MKNWIKATIISVSIFISVFILCLYVPFLMAIFSMIAFIAVVIFIVKKILDDYERRRFNDR